MLYTSCAYSDHHFVWIKYWSSHQSKSSPQSQPTPPQLDKAIQSALAGYQSVWDQAFSRMNNKAQTIADNIVNAFKAKDYSGIGSYIGSGVANALNSIDWDTVYNVAGQFDKVS